MEKTTVSQDQYTKKKIDQQTQYIPIDTLTLGSTSKNDSFTSVSHDNFNGKLNLAQNDFHHERINRSNANSKSELSIIFNENGSFPTNSITHDDFGLKKNVVKLSPIRHLEELQIVDPNGKLY